MEAYPQRRRTYYRSTYYWGGIFLVPPALFSHALRIFAFLSQAPSKVPSAHSNKTCHPPNSEVVARPAPRGILAPLTLQS